MTSRFARVGLAGLFGLLACDEAERFSPIRIDTSANCITADIDLVLPAMDREDRPWSRVIQVAMDEPGILRFWALVELKDDTGAAGQIGLVHVENDQVDIQLQLPSSLATSTDVSLRPGPSPKTAWVVETGPATMRLMLLDANFVDNPLQAVSDNLGDFPGVQGRLCEGEEEGALSPCDTTDWNRELAFVEGNAFLVSTAPFSPNATMYIYAARLDPDLRLQELTQLEFFRRCTEEAAADRTARACKREAAETTYSSIVVRGTQQDPTNPRYHQYMARDWAQNRVPTARDMVGLVLDLDRDDNLRGFVYSRETEGGEFADGPPSALATDNLAAYLLHPRTDGGASITQLSTSGRVDQRDEDRFRSLLDFLPRQLPDQRDQQETDSLQLLQMPGDIAFGQLSDGVWVVTKLFPDAPARSGISTYQANSDITTVRSAGRGAYLLFGDPQGPDLVQLRCSDES